MSGSRTGPELPPLGLCAGCRHRRTVRSDRGAVFIRCAAAAEHPSLPRYPRLPVLRCHAFAPGTTGEPDDEATNSR